MGAREREQPSCEQAVGDVFWSKAACFKLLSGHLCLSTMAVRCKSKVPLLPPMGLQSFKMLHSSLEYTHGTKGSVCDCCFCGVLQRANSKILSDVLQGKIETHSMSESDKESRRCHGLLNYWANCERIGVKCGPGAIWRVGEDSKISWAVDPPFVPFNIEYDSIANLQSVCNGYNDDKFRWPSPPKLSRRQYRLHRKTHGIVKPRAAAKPPRTMAFVVFKTEVGA